MTLTQNRYDGADTTNVERYVWQPVDVPAPRHPVTMPRSGRVVVLGGRADHRAQVVERLVASGWTAVQVDVDGAGEPASAARAVREEVVATGRVDGIVDLGPEPEFALHDHTSWRSALVRTTAALQAVYDDWAAETDANRCFYLTVTWMGGRMGYDRRGVRQPLGGVWAGMAKSLPHELATCRVKVLDLDAEEAAELGSRVALELGTFDYYEVGWRSGTRTTLGAQAAQCPPPRLRLGPSDVVLVSGGGRGVGFAFAERLAAEVGCQVVVTGRSALPTNEAWLGMDDADYASLRRDRLRDAGPRVGEVRRELERWDALRDLAANLARAEQQGLPLTYRVCDFLDLDQVRGLVDSLGPALRVVVHNAGIAAPTRLRGKSPDTVLRVVESKLVAFTNLVDALRGHDLDYFCNVGSVAGRMGGMAGQIDYAGANEVLTRLGFWAQQELGLPVGTLCWTTWERVGLIANYDAALRYGSALRVEDGVKQWTAELLAAEPTEAMFLGRVGTALAPTQIRGFLKFADHPDLPWLLSRHHYLGHVEEYAPFRSIRSRNRLAAREHPCLADVLVDGSPALPVSVAIEYAVSTGEWLPPEGWPIQHLTEVRDLHVDLGQLALTPELDLVKEATAGRESDAWLVRVRLTAGPGGASLLSAAMVYRDLPPAPSSTEPPSAVAEPWHPSENGRMSWNGVAFRRPQWRGDDKVLVADVEPASASDLWALPYPPRSVLPGVGLEAVVQGVLGAAETGGTRLTIARLERRSGPSSETRVWGRPAEGSWVVASGSGHELLRVTGAEVR